jgi:hypothetical protein
MISRQLSGSAIGYTLSTDIDANSPQNANNNASLSAFLGA